MAMDAATFGTDLITALGGPAVVGGILLGILRKNLQKSETGHSERFENMAGRFDVVADEMKEIIQSNKSQESALAEIKTRIAIAEQQSLSMARAIEEFRTMDKTLTLMQSKVDAAFRIIDDMKGRTDRVDSRIDRLDAELTGIREALRAGK